MEQPEASRASFVNISFELEPEAPLTTAETNRVPSPLPSWKLPHFSPLQVRKHTFTLLYRLLILLFVYLIVVSAGRNTKGYRSDCTRCTCAFKGHFNPMQHREVSLNCFVDQKKVQLIKGNKGWMLNCLRNRSFLPEHEHTHDSTPGYMQSQTFHNISHVWRDTTRVMTSNIYIHRSNIWFHILANNIYLAKHLSAGVL